MCAIYKTTADDLDGRFLRAVKALFKNKEIELVVCEACMVQEDETAYLLKSPANRARLLKAVENIAHDRNLVAVNIGEL